MSEVRGIIKEIKQQYNTIAKEWDISRSVPSGVKIKMVKNVKVKDKVLDLGCGNGLMVSDIIKKGAQYFGFDISKELLKIAKKKYPGLNFKLGDATKKLSYKNNYFDWVFSFAVMHHLPTAKSRLKFLQEIFRVLKKHGRAVVINWNLLNKDLAKRYKIIEQLGQGSSNDVLVPWLATEGKKIERYVHIFTKNEILKLAKEAGFKKRRAVFYLYTGVPEENGGELVLFLQK